jgi:hypothetical protein
MTISVEMSYYPLTEEYIKPIKGFIERVRKKRKTGCNDQWHEHPDFR